MPITLSLVFRPFTDPPPVSENYLKLYADGTIFPRSVDYISQHACLGWCELPKLPEPEDWIVPTDEDAKLRPACEVRDHCEKQWRDGILVAVADSTSGRFVVLDEENYALMWE